MPAATDRRPTRATRPPRERPLTIEPSERARPGRRRLAFAYPLALVLPTAVAAASIPLRDSHPRVLALMLVLPVVVVAALGATGPALVAAIMGGLSYDFFVTRPYYHLAVHDTDDIVAALALVVVGIFVGVLNSRLSRLQVGQTSRRDELFGMVTFVRSMTDPSPARDVTEAACEQLRTILGVRDCVWTTERDDSSTRPVLLDDGTVMGFLTDLHPDRARLPQVFELPAVSGGRRVGTFVLAADPQRVVSLEERLTAATIAALCAHAVAARTA